MKIKQLSLFAENKPGLLHKSCKVLADAGINISSLCVADTEDYGILRLLVRDWKNAEKILKDAGFIVRMTDVVAICVDNKPHGLSDVLAALDAAAVNVEYMYAFAEKNDGKAVLIFRFDDADAALEKLQDKNLVILDEEMLYAD